MAAFTIFYSFSFQASALEAAGGCVDCLSSQAKELQRYKDFGCDLGLFTNECKKWFDENPETLKYAKSCSKNEGPEGQTWLKACVDAGIENWSEILSLLSTSANAIETCDNNMECKRQLAKDAFFVCKNKDGSNQYPCTDEKQLSDVYAGDLMRKRDKVRTLALQDKDYREKLIQAGVLLPLPGKGVDFSFDLLKKIAEAKLGELEVKYSCYNSAGYALMACYAIASVVDPSIVLGAPGTMLKGSKWVHHALKSKKINRAKSTVIPQELKTFDTAAGRLIPGAISKNPQIAAWQYHEVGDVASASKIEERLAKEFSSSKVVRTQDIKDSSNGAKLVTLENGMQGVWKEDTFGMGRHEVVAYNLDKHLGLNSVPLTIKRKLGNKEGTLQFFVPSTKKVPRLEYLEDPDFFLLQDYLTQNRDRHIDNYFYHEGRPIAIDNGLSFNPKYPGPNFPKRVKEIMDTKKRIDRDIEATSAQIKKSSGFFANKDKLKNLSTQLRELKNRRQELILEVSGLGINKQAAEKLEKTSVEEWNRITKDLTAEERKDFLNRKDSAVAAIKEARTELGENIFPTGPQSPWDPLRNDVNEVFEDE